MGVVPDPIYYGASSMMKNSFVRTLLGLIRVVNRPAVCSKTASRMRLVSVSTFVVHSPVYAQLSRMHGKRA